MPGIQLLFTLPDHDRASLLPAASPLPTEHVVTIHRDDVCTIRVFAHETYPYRSVVTGDAVLVFEGAVYGCSDDETISRLTAIGQTYAAGEPVTDPVTRFVEASDGDFIVLIYDRKRRSLILFNDQYARLPLFVYRNDVMFIASRRISYVLPAVPSLTVDMQSVAEYLAFEHYLGDKTAFTQFSRVAPGALVHVELNAAGSSGRVTARVGSTVPAVFDEIDRERSRSVCVDEYARRFLTSLTARYEKVAEWGFAPTVDLSGGYDSRTVMMGLERLGLDASYYTHVVINEDERTAARSLADAYGRELTVVTADHTLLVPDMERLVYATDMTVNAWTTVSCWNDYLERRRLSPPSAVFFTGLGGGYPRHPFKPVAGIRSLERMTELNVLPSQLPLVVPASVMNLSADRYVAAIADHFRHYEEKTVQGRFKRYYFNYHKNVYAGEDRTRSIAWTISPFDSTLLMRYTLRSIPLEDLGFSFFIAFMRELGGVGMRVPIRGSSAPLTMPFGGNLLNVQAALRASMRSFIMRNRKMFRIYEILTKAGTLSADYRNGASLAAGYLDRSPVCARVFDRAGMDRQIGRGMNIAGLYRLLSVMMYLKQLEQLYGDALAIE